MSAAIASSRSPSRTASAMKGSSSTISTRMLRCYEPAPVVAVSKTGYVPATPRFLEWRHDLQQASANSVAADSDSLDPCHRPARRHRGDRRPRLPVIGVVVVVVVVDDGRADGHGVGTWAGRGPDRTVAGPGRP